MIKPTAVYTALTVYLIDRYFLFCNDHLLQEKRRRHTTMNYIILLSLLKRPKFSYWEEKKDREEP